MMQAREEFLWGADSAAPAASFLPWWALPAPQLGPAAAWGKALVSSAARSWTLRRARFWPLWETTAPPLAPAPAAPFINSLLISLPVRESRRPWDSAEPSLFTTEPLITPIIPQSTAPAASSSAAADSRRQNLRSSEFRSPPAP